MTRSVLLSSRARYERFFAFHNAIGLLRVIRSSPSRPTVCQGVRRKVSKSRPLGCRRWYGRRCIERSQAYGFLVMVRNTSLPLRPRKRCSLRLTAGFTAACFHPRLCRRVEAHQRSRTQSRPGSLLCTHCTRRGIAARNLNRLQVEPDEMDQPGRPGVALPVQLDERRHDPERPFASPDGGGHSARGLQSRKNRQALTR